MAISLSLPKKLSLWSRADAPQVVTSKTIFAYMDGAGELYLGYKFDHLDVFEYKAKDQDDILVEIYYMKAPEEAFGLLSQDWGGDATGLGEKPESAAAPVIPNARALYGAGLLRMWTDTIYARIMSFRETSESKAVVLELGKIVAQGHPVPPEPAILKNLPAKVDGGWKILADQTCFFHSFYVLNSKYYISHKNIFCLDLSVDAVIAKFERNTEQNQKQTVTYLYSRYPDPEKAQKGLNEFAAAYIPEYKADLSKEGEFHIQKIEDGFSGFTRKGQSILAVFECPDQATTQAFLKTFTIEK